MPATLEIGGRPVGGGAACFVIAEAGVNHNGSIALAHELVDLAATSGADAVKFQTFDPGRLVSSSAAPAPYQEDRGSRSQMEMLSRLALPDEAWPELAAHAGDSGLLFMSTAFDLRSLELLLAIGVPVLKIPSGELNNLALIARHAACGLPMIISTGLGTLEEVGAAIDAAAAAPAVAVLHCVTSYPAPTHASNLRALQTMRDELNVQVGWSDHTAGHVTMVAALALGASIVEKHVTTDRSLEGPDHAASADPAEFTRYVAILRETEAALGSGVKEPQAVELPNLRFVRRSYHASKDLARDETIRSESVELLRPADGLPPGADVVGRRSTRAIRAGEAIMPEDIG